MEANDAVIGDYTIYATTAGAQAGTKNNDAKGIGGVSIVIVIRTALPKRITEIQKIDERLIHIRMTTSVAKKNLFSINSYAPYIEYGEETRRINCENIRNTVQSTDKRDCLIWATDNNGHPSRKTKTTAPKPITNSDGRISDMQQKRGRRKWRAAPTLLRKISTNRNQYALCH